MTLPIELVVDILIYAYIDSREKSIRNFQRFCLVCKGWTFFAQRLLYRHVRLIGAPVIRGFLSATRPSSDPDSLGARVRSLEVFLFSSQMKKALPFILRHCPNLRELSLSGPGVTALNFKLLQRPKASGGPFANIDYDTIPLPNLQALSLNTETSAEEACRTFFDIWPEIRHLSLEGFVVRDFLVPGGKIPEAKDLPGAIVTLSEVRFGPKASDFPIVYRTFLQYSVGVLTILDLAGVDQSTITRLDDVFEDHGPYLRSIRFPPLGLGTQVHFLQFCTRLEEVKFENYPPMDIMDKMLIQSMEHVSFVTVSDQLKYSVRPLLRWLATMPSIRVLTWSLRATSDMTPGDVRQVEAFCVDKEIRLRMFGPISNRHLPEELLEPAKFPRDEVFTPSWV